LTRINLPLQAVRFPDGSSSQRTAPVGALPENRLIQLNTDELVSAKRT